jgi:hypothetical protein
MRFLGGLVVVVGLLLMAGGNYVLPGVGLVLAGLWASGKQSTSWNTGRASDVLTAGVAVLGGLGALALIAQFVIERITAFP